MQRSPRRDRQKGIQKPSDRGSPCRRASSRGNSAARGEDDSIDLEGRSASVTETRDLNQSAVAWPLRDGDHMNCLNQAPASGGVGLSGSHVRSFQFVATETDVELTDNFDRFNHLSS